MTRRSSGLSLQEIAGAPLRALTRFGGSELAERLGLHKAAQKVIYRGTRAGVRAVSAGVSFARSQQGDGARAAKRLAKAASSGLFDLTPTGEQAIMRDAMRRFADEVLRPSARAADDAAAPPAEVLAQGQGLGLAGLAVPESLGGQATERSAVTYALVAEELARGDMGLATAILAPLAAVQAIVEWGTGAQQQRYLPPFLGEAFIPAALALLEPRPLFDPMRLRTGAVRAAGATGGWELHGEKSLVPLATSAALIVVAAEVRGLGPRLFVVEAGARGLTVEPEPAMGLRGAALGRVRLEGVRVEDDAMLGDFGDDGPEQLGVLVDRARVAWGAMAVGTAQAVLDYVIPYCNDRKAFGEPISNRQGVAFPIADMAIELEGMRLLVLRAASRMDRGASAAREAALARLQCASKGMKIGSDGVQLLGGHGFIKEHPVERWYRDLRAIGVLEGALLA